MQGRIVGAIVAVSLLISGAVIVRGVTRGLVADGEVMPPPRRGPRNGGVPEMHFKFSPTAKGEEQGGAPDWQEATATLTFSDLRGARQESWTCRVVVGMPLRTDTWGEIAPDYAAYAAASAATDAANELSKAGAPPDFCERLRGGMQKQLDGIEGLGAEVGGGE